MADKKFNRLGVFCGAKKGHLPIFSEAAESLADAMFAAGIDLVYGGSRLGIMNVIANRMLEKGGKVIGVIPEALLDKEGVHETITELHIVNSMAARKELILQLSDGFTMLSGGVGTLDEFFEMFTLSQLKFHEKPCSILNVSGYYDHLLQFLDHAVAQGFLKQQHRDMIIVEQSPQLLIKRLVSHN